VAVRRPPRSVFMHPSRDLAEEPGQPVRTRQILRLPVRAPEQTVQIPPRQQPA